MKIAVPVWNEMVSPVLDAALTLRVYDVVESVPTKTGEIALQKQGCSLADTIASSADTLICGALSQTLERELLARNVSIHPWVMGESDLIVACYVRGSLDAREYTMPGCRRNRYGNCNRRRSCGFKRDKNQ